VNATAANKARNLQAAQKALELLYKMTTPEVEELVRCVMVGLSGDTVAASKYCCLVANGFREINPKLADDYRAAHALIEERSRTVTAPVEESVPAQKTTGGGL
jgi:hypothetical protein